MNRAKSVYVLWKIFRFHRWKGGPIQEHWSSMRSYHYASTWVGYMPIKNAVNKFSHAYQDGRLMPSIFPFRYDLRKVRAEVIA